MKIKSLLSLILLFCFTTISFAQNPSDGCAGVPVLTVNGTCTNTNFGMPGSYSDGGLVNATCASAGQDRDDGWYQFTATATSTTIEASADRAIAISVWTTCAGTQLAPTANTCDIVTTGNTASITFATVATTTYFVQIHRRGGNNNASIATGSVCVYSAVAPTCSDGIQNQGETGIDCGGPCAACVPTCSDGIQNQGETGVDCGGPCIACGACSTDAAIAALPYNQTGLNTNGA